MGIKIEKAERLKVLPPYLFAEIDKARRKAIDEGRPIIDLGVGDPDQPTPKYIIEALYEAAKDPKNHHYGLDLGMPEFKVAISKWYQKRFNIKLDATCQILPLIGSKEGIAHLPLAFVNPDDIVLVPDPCYPPYRGGTIFAGGKVCPVPLLEKNAFLPDIETIDKTIAKKAKLFFLNYPNNPTGAVADKAFFKKVIKFALDFNIIIAHDLAYSEVCFDGYKPPSILEIDGASDVAIEFHSLSKTFNMTGWRVGWACGNKEVVENLARVKSNIDSGIFNAIQLAATIALEGPDKELRYTNKVYQERRDVLVDGLNKLGWKVNKPKATFYIWAKVFKDYDSATFSKLLLEQADLITTPGVGFGQGGEGFIRMALTVSKEKIKEAVDRISRLNL